MIRVENLVKAFGAKLAVNDVSFTVERGEVLGFLGPNGAGKSTTMRMITGFIPPTSGRITIGGHDMLEDPLPAKRLIGYLPENAPGYADMTVTASSTSRPSCAGCRATRASAPSAARSSCAFSRTSPIRPSTRSPRVTSTAPDSRNRWSTIPRC